MTEKITKVKETVDGQEYYAIKVLLNDTLLTYERVSNLKEGKPNSEFDATMGYGTRVHIITEGKIVFKAIEIKE